MAASLAIYFLPMAAQAQGLFEQAVAGETESAAEDGGAAGINFELSGYVRGDLWVGEVPDELTDDDSEWEQKAGYGEAALRVRARSGEFGDGYADLRFRSGNGFADEDEALKVHEAYVNVYAGPFDLRFGHQIIVWGRADGINPTNNITPYDYRVHSPEEDDRRMANLGLRSHYNIDRFRLETIWMPTYAESHFPEFEIDAPIEFADPNYPGNSLSGGLGAFRLSYIGPEIDWSLSYVYGYAPFPGIEFRQLILPTTPPLTPTIEVGFRAYQHYVVGADFSTVIGTMGMRGEVAYKYPYRYEDREWAPNPELHYVLGADHEFMNGDIWVIVQYVGKHIFDWEEVEGADVTDTALLSTLTPAQLESLLLDEITLVNRMLFGQQDEYSHAAMARIQLLALQETLSVELLGMYNFTTYESMVRPMVAYDIADALEVSCGAEIYRGPDDTLNGIIDESQSAIFLEMKASF